MFEINYLAWWILGAILLLSELAVPGAFLLWIGIASILLGLVDFIWPISLQTQLVLFALFSILSVLLGRKVMRSPSKNKNDYATLNERGEQYIGGIYVLTKAIEEGRGKAKVGDSEWLVSGPDLPKGAHVKVVGVEGTSLKVVREKK